MRTACFSTQAPHSATGNGVVLSITLSADGMALSVMLGRCASGRVRRERVWRPTKRVTRTAMVRLQVATWWDRDCANQANTGSTNTGSTNRRSIGGTQRTGVRRTRVRRTDVRWVVQRTRFLSPHRLPLELPLGLPFCFPPPPLWNSPFAKRRKPSGITIGGSWLPVPPSVALAHQVAHQTPQGSRRKPETLTVRVGHLQGG
jgi:hypothetical protein